MSAYSYDIHKKRVLMIELLPLISKSGLGVVDFVALQRSEKGGVKQVNKQLKCHKEPGDHDLLIMVSSGNS